MAVGKKFGRWTVVARAENVVDTQGKNQRVWSCLCTCGTVRDLRGNWLLAGNSRSCGCSRVQHGLSKTRAHDIWSGMMDRCYNPSNRSYKNYGGRGITVCERWHSVINFRDDMASLESLGVHGRITLERVDNERGYSLDNCRWASYAEQSHNRRNTRLTWSAVAEIRNSRDSYAVLSDRFGVNQGQLSQIVHNTLWIDENYRPPPKCLIARCLGRDPGSYVGPARMSDRHPTRSWGAQLSETLAKL